MNYFRKPAADTSRHGRNRSRILLCSAAGAGVFKFRSFRPALAHILNGDGRDAETFSTLKEHKPPNVLF